MADDEALTLPQSTSLNRLDSPQTGINRPGSHINLLRLWLDVLRRDKCSRPRIRMMEGDFMRAQLLLAGGVRSRARNQKHSFGSHVFSNICVERWRILS